MLECCLLADAAFKQSRVDVAFALVRAGECRFFSRGHTLARPHPCRESRSPRLGVTRAAMMAGVHKYCVSNDKLCKRYLFYLEMIVKGKATTNKQIEGPPHMLYVRELKEQIFKEQIFKEQILAVVRAAVSLAFPAPLPHASPFLPAPISAGASEPCARCELALADTPIPLSPTLPTERTVTPRAP